MLYKVLIAAYITAVAARSPDVSSDAYFRSLSQIIADVAKLETEVAANAAVNSAICWSAR